MKNLDSLKLLSEEDIIEKISWLDSGEIAKILHDLLFIDYYAELRHLQHDFAALLSFDEDSEED